ncbi:hypothetical protein BJ170DRAFT_415616 [Xylariales sp. AK1849]|nr:hypothetical protein BJ170DRAFT_415616 [Xylariales sp. AK1849]
MTLLGLSLVLASVVWLIFRRPPVMETLMALWRGQPSSTQAPRPGTPNTSPTQADSSAPSISLPRKVEAELDRAAMPAPPKLVGPDKDGSSSEAESPQTTPRARAASSSGAVPSFSLSLSASPPASAAAVARANDATSPSSPPTLSSAPVTTPLTMMPPPPRPPTLNSLNKPSLLAPTPARNGLRPNGLANSARQPGTSTLAPPPTHSSKPTKPSRKVILTPGHSPLDWARVANSPTSDLRNLPPSTPYLKITPSQLKKQTGRRGKDAWTALGGRVYNITPYLPFHPGGEPELLRVAGRDGTKLFGEIHPWVNYEGMLASSLIGMLVEEGEQGGNGVMDEMD